MKPFKCSTTAGAGLLTALLLSAPLLSAAAAQKPAFAPNPRLAGLPDNTAVELGPFVWERAPGETCGGSVTDFGGMTYDMHNHRILLFGGGHSATDTDSLLSFDLSTLKWSALYKPTPVKYLTKENLDNGFWKAGETGPYPRPASRHTYDLLVVPDDAAELLMLRNGDYSMTQHAYYNSNCGVYDFKTGKWKVIPPQPFGGWGGVCEYDPISKKVIGNAGNNGQGLFVFDPATGKSQMILDDLIYKYKANGDSGTMVYCPVDRKMYVIQTNAQIWSIDLDRANLRNSKIAVLQPSGEKPPGGECAYAYDAKNVLIGGGVKDNKFYAYDPAKNAWLSQNIQGAKPGTMTFHCLIYDPVDNVYVFIAGNKTYAYRWKR